MLTVRSSNLMSLPPAFVLTMSVLCCGNAHGQVLSPTLTLYRSESAFLNAVPVVSTETFDSFATGTELEFVAGEHPLVPGYETFYRTTVDDVDYSVIDCNTAGICFPWTVTDQRRNVGPVSSPNLLAADGSDIERHQAITFGTGNHVEGIGFYFIAEEIDLPTPPPTRAPFWNMFIVEKGIGGGGHNFRLDFGSEMPTYLGFHSTLGIEGIVIFDAAGEEFYGLPTYWAYDNVSRTEIVPEPYGGASLLGTVLVTMAATSRQSRRRARRRSQ